MILDKRTEFADAEAVAGAADTYNVGDVIDSVVANDLGAGQPVYLVIQIVTAPAGATTCKFQLVSDDLTTPDDGGAQSVHLATDDIAIADLPAGTEFVFTLPQNNAVPYERYLGVQEVNVGGGSLTALVVNAFLTLDPPKRFAYPDAVN